HLSSFFFSCHGTHRDPPSFPTRRSSDLPEHTWPGAHGLPQPPQLSMSTAVSRQVPAHSVRRSPQPSLHAPSLHSSPPLQEKPQPDRKSTRLNSSHLGISYAVFCLKKKKQ